MDFEDLTFGSPTGWAWTFPDGTPSSSSSASPQDVVFSTVEAGISAVGAAGSIITHAVRDIARVAGDLGSELFEIRDAARRARAEHEDTEAD